MRNDILLWLILGFAGGIVFRSFFDLGIAIAIVFSVVAFALALIWLVHERKGTTILLVAAALFGGSLGILRYEKAELPKNQTIESTLQQPVVLRGVVVSEPDERENATLLYVQVSTLGDESVDEKILAAVQTYSKASYGDAVELSGVLQYPDTFETQTGRTFDYRAYLAKEGIRYEMSFPTLTIIEHGKGNVVLQSLYALKRSFLHNIEIVIPEPQASLLGGLVVGAKHSLGKELLDEFRTVGVVHIVVLSGYNVTIVADFIQKLFAFLPHYFGIGLGSLSIVLFALMTGVTATTVRASIMALIAIAARTSGRTYAISRALVLAGFLMLLQNPKILVFDTSFQLSFLSTLGLIYLAPRIEPKLMWIPERFGLREIVTATLSTQLFVLPFLLYTTGIFSIVSLPANLLILPLVPLTMLFGFLAGVLGFIATTVSLPFAWMASVLLSYMLFVVERFSTFSFAALSLPAFSFAIVAVAYVAIGVYLLRTKSSSQQRLGTASKSS